MDMKDNKTGASSKRIRHIIALSGGKDSSALAVYLRGKIPNVEYVFCDTGEELKETYEFIAKIENYLNISVTKLRSIKNFKYYLDLYNGVLPDARTRWCTRMLKLKPFEEYIGDDPVINYVGIRADELHREGYISTKSNVKTVFPFVEDNIRREDVLRILQESGLGLPRYYEWRSRSGCYFCFFQQKREWVGLLENHPDLFEKAKAYEKFDPITGERYTWNQDESLDELSRSERIAEIKAEYEERKYRQAKAFKSHQKLQDIWGAEDFEDDVACTICRL